MPNISTYQPQIRYPHAVDTGDSAAAAGEAISRAFHNVGQNIAQVADVIDRRVSQQETSKLTKEGSDQLFGLITDWNNTAAKTDPNEIDKAAEDWQRDVLSPAIEKLGGDVFTRQGNELRGRLQIQIKTHLQDKIMADQSVLGGVAVHQNLDNTINTLSQAAYADPSVKNPAIAMFQDALEGQLSTHRLTPAQAATIRSELGVKGAKEIERSAGNKMAETNPAELQKALSEGAFKYLDGTDITALQNYADTRQRISEAEDARKLAAFDKAKRDASDDSYHDFAQQIAKDPTKVDLSDPEKTRFLSGAHIDTLIHLRNSEIERLKKAAGGDDEEKKGPGFWNAYQSVISGRITDPTSIYNMAGPGKPLTLAGANALFELAKKVKEGPNKGDFETQKLAKFDAEIHRQIVSPDGITLFPNSPERNTAETNYTRAWFDSRKAIEEGKRKGLSLDEMLDDRSPNYIMKNLQAYQAPKEALRYPGTNPGEKFDIKALDTQFKDGREGMVSGLKALQDAVAAYRRDPKTGISPEQAIGYALKRGWGVIKKPAAPTVPPAR